jgi:predicted unusual protein kinase regulating ubiquinone biosynthesis (AarF/ABC1/UbiB family)
VTKEKEGKEGSGGVPRSRLGRLGRLGRLAAGIATDVAGAAGRVAVGAARDAAAARLHQQAADRLFDTLGKMKGLPMKVGQMLSYVDDVVPAIHRAAYRETLQKLQVKAQPLAWKDLEAVIRQDLGGGPEEIFSRFDPEPIAAASIGQVYRAALPGGTEVAVKVQYPGIADAIRSDLRNIDMLRSGLSAVLPKVEVDRTLADIQARVLEECDYGCELANQTEFREFWSGDRDVLVPRVFGEFSAEHVITTEFVDGRTWQEIVRDDGPEERSRLGRTLFRFVFRSIYVRGMFHADPHPGNYLFPADGRVAFVDFGCVQRFPLDVVRAFRDVRRMAMAGTRGAPLREAMVRAYGLPEDFDPEEWDYVERYVLSAFEPFLHDRTFRFDRAYTGRVRAITKEGVLLGARKALRRGIWESSRPGFVFLNRIQYGLVSVLSQMGAEANWHRMLLEIDEEMDE